MSLQRLVLVRHGETVGQSSIRYYGATDLPLSDSGREQMARVRDALAGERFDGVYTSGLLRTIAAARIIAPDVPAHMMSGFNEINFGQWEGLTREEIAVRDPHRYREWRASVHEFSYPDGDTVSAFRARVAATMHAWVRRAPERALVIVHRGIISTFLSELLQLTADKRAALPIDLGSIHVLAARQGTWQAEVVNRTDHLEGLV